MAAEDLSAEFLKKVPYRRPGGCTSPLTADAFFPVLAQGPNAIDDDEELEAKIDELCKSTPYLSGSPPPEKDFFFSV